MTGALKCYLRELPEPLMTFELYSDWFKAAGCVSYLHLSTCLFISTVLSSLFLEFDLVLLREKDLTEKLEQFRLLLKKLPPENYNNLRCVCSLCAFVVPESRGQMSQDRHPHIQHELNSLLATLETLPSLSPRQVSGPVLVSAVRAAGRKQDDAQ